jgi:hypothetical protein
MKTKARFRSKTIEALLSCHPESAAHLKGTTYPKDIENRIARSLRNIGLPPRKARSIAFHITDTIADASFMTALALHPSKFTDDEISDAVASILVHTPDHLAAAAELWGVPVTDVFEVKSKKERPTRRCSRRSDLSRSVRSTARAISSRG